MHSQHHLLLCTFRLKDRVLAAKRLLEKLLSSPIKNTLVQLDKVCDGYIQLANYEVPKSNGLSLIVLILLSSRSDVDVVLI